MCNENKSNYSFTYEELDNHITNVDLADFKPGGRYHFDANDVTANPGGVLQKVCKVYNAIRPILVIISKIPLIPSKFTKPLQAFIIAMDTICSDT